jgi:hypothetical protein
MRQTYTRTEELCITKVGSGKRTGPLGKAFQE